MSEFSNRIKKLRLKDNKKQSDIADILGVSVQSYCAYEAGREPKYDLLCKIAKHYNVTIDYLLGLDDGATKEHASINERTGLSEEAIKTLEYCLAKDKKNSITLAVNALLEDRYLLGLISYYLYYLVEPSKMFQNYISNAGDVNSSPLAPYTSKYKYYKYEYMSDTLWNSEGWPKDPSIKFNAFDNKKYRQLILLDFQEALAELAKKEDEKEYFK
jgi:transcriptional regulator with XRE-family HTH domain